MKFTTDHTPAPTNRKNTNNYELVEHNKAAIILLVEADAHNDDIRGDNNRNTNTTDCLSNREAQLKKYGIGSFPPTR